MTNSRKHWTGSWRGGIALVGLAVLMHAPGQWSIPPVDRDEARFAEASRQMLEGGGWRSFIVPMFDDEPRLNKPPLIYWLQSASVRWLRGGPGDRGGTAGLPDGGIWAYRMPSMLAALLAVLATWRLGLRMFPPQVAFLGAVLLASCLVVMVDARQARADQVLLACTVLSQAGLYRIWRLRGRPATSTLGPALLLWTAMGLGMMTKGPVTPAVAVLTALSLCVVERRWRWLLRAWPALGVIILALMVVPWLVLVGRAVGFEVLGRTIADEVLGRSMSAKEGHTGPPGYYLLLLPVCFWPGCFALAPGIAHAFRRALRRPSLPNESTGNTEDSQRSGNAVDVRGAWLPRLTRWVKSLRPGRDAELFCLAWLIPTWLVFEMAATKLPHYTLPTYPALALVCARGIYSSRGLWERLFRHPLGRAAAWGWLILTELIAVICPLAVAYMANMASSSWLIGLLVAAAIINQTLVVVCVQNLRRREVGRVLGASIICAGVVSITVFAVVLPNLNGLWISSRLVQQIREIDPQGRRPVIAVGYQEDSLVFLTEGRVKRVHWLELPRRVAEQPDLLAIVGDHHDVAEKQSDRLATVRGFNYSKGEWVTVDLVQPNAK